VCVAYLTVMPATQIKHRDVVQYRRLGSEGIQRTWKEEFVACWAATLDVAWTRKYKRILTLDLKYTSPRYLLVFTVSVFKHSCSLATLK
jgi:hypothetical protein